MPATWRTPRIPVKHPLILLVRVYQWTIAPALPPTCRFHPSCSAYMIEALEVHGALRGLWLGLRRILRCQPFCPGGYDAVPPRLPPTQRN
jgi:hypothetical protein